MEDKPYKGKRESDYFNVIAFSFYLALFVNFVAIQYRFQLISWYIVVKSPGEKERKELLVLFRELTLYIQGKNSAPGIFPKATIYAKTTFYLLS
ncbi:hypothetical protein D3H55_18885 [Bacillus salacetis]|uniref:Uncharacterized protein n=1 Tax=Bacillus salacetis TaxID=2315464 RepID=A0A3A1QWI3_9BACI|nr:hypothetical protein D3H55_18885 [Bacillus salacetis]